MTSTTPTVAQAMARVMSAVPVIGKDQAVTTGPARFRFRGVDDVMQAVGAALRAHGVIFAPSRVISLDHERYETSKGAPMDGVTVVVEYTITGPAGDTMTAAAAGQAADAGDKAVPKAMSVAYRTVLLQTLCVPSGEPDPDTQVHERAPINSQPTAPGGDPEMVAAVLAEAAAAGLGEDVVRADAVTRYSRELEQLSPDTLRDLWRSYHARASDPVVQTPPPIGVSE